MPRNRVMVEINASGQPVRIFKKPSYAIGFPPDQIAEWPRIEAERAIKKQILERQDHICAYCPRPINMSAHIHERVFRSKGGEVSLENSVVLCPECHISPRGEHKDRYPQWRGGRG